MSLTIGRCGLDVTLADHASMSSSGDRISLTGVFRASSLADAKVLRQQLLGHVNNRDEPVVPVTSSYDTTIDGFYRVLGASVDLDVQGNDYGNFRFPYSVELERVSGTYNPLLERTHLAALRTNSHAIVLASVVEFFGVPSRSSAASVTNYTSESRTSADGVTLFFYNVNPNIPVIVSSTALNPSELPTADAAWYDSGCILESKWADNATYRAVTGRQMPVRISNGVRPGHDWRISNGFVRVMPAATTGAANSGCDISVEHYDGAQWDTGKRYTFTLETVALASAKSFSQVTVLENNTACVVIRLAVEDNDRAWLLDIRLRRGSRFIECRWSLSSTGVVVVARDSAEAATALTGGIRATSNDGGGNRFVLASPQATTNDLVNGRITSSAGVTAYDFMIGSEVTGTSATGQATAQNQVYQYMCAQSETYRVVGR